MKISKRNLQKYLFLLIALGGIFVAVKSIWFEKPYFSYRFRIAPSVAKANTETILREKIAKNPNAAFEMTDLANHLLSEAKRRDNANLYDEASELAKRSLEILPQPNLGSKIVLANTLQAKHAFTAADTLANEVLTEQQAHPGALQIRATIALARGDLSLAARLLSKKLSSQPDTQGFAFRGWVYSLQGRGPEAELDFKRAVRSEDFGQREVSAEARNFMARHYMSRGQYSTAHKALEISLVLNPENPFTHYLKGECLWEEREYRKAGEKYLKAFELTPHPKYLVAYGRSLYRQGKIESAKQYLSRAIGLLRKDLKENPTGHGLDLVEGLLWMSTPDSVIESLGIITQEQKERPQSLELLFWKIIALEQKGRRKQAKALLNQALATGVRSAKYYALAARLSGNDSPAGRVFQQLLNEKNPKFSTESLPDPMAGLASSKPQT